MCIDDDNNLLRYNLDDFFKLNMYSGEIYKVKNLRNLTLRQQFPEDEAYKHAQDSIENRLHQFDKDLWVPDREELQARAQTEKEAAKAHGETVDEGDGDSATEDSSNEQATATKSVRKTTKRGSKRTSAKEKKHKTAKVKTRKPKSSGNQGGSVRSVRNRKR